MDSMNEQIASEFERLYELKLKQITANHMQASPEFRFWCLALHLAKRDFYSRASFLETSKESSELQSKVQEILDYINRRSGASLV
jgi:hypothetical protein